MRDLKIRTKILLTVGVVIILSIVFAIFVIMSSLTTINNVKNVQVEAEMQALSSHLIEHFGAAETGAGIISVKFDDESYNSAVANLKDCTDSLAEINALLDENEFLSYLHSDVDKVSAAIAEWSKNVDDIQKTNKEMEALVEEARKRQLDLTGQSSGIFDYQMELSKEEAGQDLPEANRLRRVSRIESGMVFSSNIEYVGNSFEVMFKSFDTSRLDDDYKVLEDTIALLEEFLAESTLQYNIETAASMIQALKEYEDSITSFLSLLTYRDDLIETTEAESKQAMAAVNALFDKVDESVTNHVDEMVNTSNGTLVIVIIFSVLAAAIAMLFAFYTAGIISKPLAFLETVLGSISATGQTVLSEDDIRVSTSYARQKDEIGSIANSVNGIIKMLGEKVEALEYVAGGDLTFEISHRSDNDTISSALQKTIDSLNDIFAETGGAASQVSNASSQVADASQSLAQGSIQQAASVEELNASIDNVSDAISKNADMAREASELSNVIKRNAETGSRQMDEMMQAVKDINEASASIGKVIKVIDDIAFQTNILALNAAVEAARAGQHGKGFAVVADEVRNLAAKSASAAKDTSGLISNSIDKAKLGFDLATETAASLKDIVESIDKSAEVVTRIAASSEEQASSIAEINKGINEVANVVHQNSAAAEQSAAASEEMSSQADLLKQLITRFKIKPVDASTRTAAMLGVSMQTAPMSDATGFSISGDDKY